MMQSALTTDILSLLNERSKTRQRANAQDAIEHIKNWFRAGLHLPDDVHITVTEVACADPSCPIRETFVLVLTEHARQWRIGKPLLYVRQYDVAIALERTEGDGLSQKPHQ
jgi:hypothetical protein